MTALPLLQAAALVLAYLALCWRCLGRRGAASEGASGATLLVAYASQGGEAEAIARRHGEMLGRTRPVRVLPLNQVDAALLRQVHTGLFVASTYGEGESPDNALRFARQWLRARPAADLSHLHYAVLALGDSAYRQFCAFGDHLDRGLSAHGGRQLFPAIKVDRMDAAALQQWRRELQACGLLEATGDPISATGRELPRLPCRLLQRRQLNPGSAGGPVFHLRFEARAGNPWQAGDIAVFDVPGPAGSSEKREYSIASIAEHGSLDLLVRQVRKDDGSLGLGSGWLGATLPLGGEVLIGLRDNPAFQPPPDAAPLILVGNGTGIAGLRAHLQARELAGQPRNWLVFGERARAHDSFFDDELRAWVSGGHLQRLDRVFSREGEPLRYVQDLLVRQSALLADWLAQGACIYVCGSARGMAPAVHRVLLDVLGEAALEGLLLAGRYRRDVY
ncbi:sulfite reductase subunit alpha [Haliea sp. E17]|uniref:sulfite reductase subunit alpha n=1 Tax=Haliea sp. E17 TaxID=3401576 RepID=UPI003AAF3551